MFDEAINKNWDR